MAEPLMSEAGKKALESVVSDLYGYLKSTLGVRFKAKLTLARIDELYRHVSSVRMVKTLWQVDKPVDLGEFYCPSHILVPDDRKKLTPTKERFIRRRVNSVEDLPPDRHIVIEGIAGLGKSILLRHLCGTELILGNVIPVFVELRRIQRGETLLDHIGRFMDIIGLEVDEVLFRAMAKSGRIMLFLDGFDEIARSQKTRILNELEYLARREPQARYIVTARPESDIQMSSLFSVVRLDNLRDQEYETIIKKLAESTEFADTLISQVKKHEGGIRELLLTPLLVTLLLISYKSYRQLPTQMSDFYGSVFPILLQRHDGTKAGYQRPRRCNMNDMEYRRVFDALCFESKQTLESVFDSAKLYEFGRLALSRSGISEDPSSFIQDIVKVTSLILKEGDEHRFIHKSVQEYFAASYIRSKPETVVGKFYKKCASDSNLRWNWSQELRFLSEIDRYRYTKYCLLPYCLIHLGRNVEQLPPVPPAVTPANVRYILGPASFLSLSHRKSDDPFLLYNVNAICDKLSSLAGDSYKATVAEEFKRALAGLSHDLYQDKELRNGRERQKALMVQVDELIVERIMQTAYRTAQEAISFLAQEDECSLGDPFGD